MRSARRKRGPQPTSDASYLGATPEEQPESGSVLDVPLRIMVSNFDFLPEDKNWCKDVRRAERRIYSDPASACAKARRALEFIVGEVYERELDADAQGDFFADVDARPFQQWMQRRDADLYDAFHHIRQSGNQGAHHQKEGDVEPKEALATVRSLKQAV